MYELLNSYLMALRDPKGICYPVKIDNKKKKITLFDYRTLYDC